MNVNERMNEETTLKETVYWGEADVEIDNRTNTLDVLKALLPCLVWGAWDLLA